ncbi:MAG: hypothetical protein CAF44_015290 [Nitrospira sp. CG24D]|nr:MAG: hypothetical protein CAF44_015290 [Nitrospira sp. CG24D]
MPRKTSTAATKDYLRADYDQWRALARNRDFCKDLADYLKNSGPNLSPEERKSPVLSRKLLKKFERLQKQFLKPWGIERVPDPALWQEAEQLITPEGLEHWYQAAREQRADFTTQFFHPAYMSNIRRGSRPDERLIEFRLNISLPVDQLLALIEKELRAWAWKHLGEHPRGKPASLDFHLKVFDLMHPLDNRKRLPILDIARKLKRKPSTIRDAYYSARRKIESLKEMDGTRNLVQRLSDPGPFSECSDHRCRKAGSNENDWCEAHRAWVDQDYVSGHLPVAQFWSDATHFADHANSVSAPDSADSSD